MKKNNNKIYLFNGKHKRFGGFNHGLARLTRVDYLFFQFGWFKPVYDHQWYDGQHHWISFGPIRICWGRKPIKDLP